MTKRLKKNILLIVVCLISFYPGLILAQQNGQLPGGMQLQEGEEAVWYTIKKGDYLKGIADMYGTTYQELHKINPYIKNVNLIYPGNKILFIDRKGVEKARRAREAAALDAERQRLAEERKLAEERARLDKEKAAEERRLAEERRRLEEERRRMEEARNKPVSTEEEYPMYIAFRGFAKLPGDINAMDVAPFGYGGGFDWNIQINKWFAFMFSLDGSYLYGNNHTVTDKGQSLTEAESIGFAVKPYFLLQRNISLQDSGIQPYIGVGPSYTLSVQNVIESQTSNCNLIKNHMGVSAVTGFNYIYKDFLFGINLEYNYVLPLSRDEQAIHTDLSSGFTAGIRLGYRFKE